VVPGSGPITHLNAFTVDVEDYFQVSAFEQGIVRSCWEQYSGRVVQNTLRLLELLAEHHIRGTFFVVGWVADHYPKLVREISAAGHEIGSHSYWHRLVYQLTPDEFRADLVRSRQVLEDLLGSAIRIFRAPSFSITRRSCWALEILAEEGFQVDSSIFPVYHDRYGMPNANPAIHQLRTRAGTLWECPPTVVRLAGVNIPVAGGGYFRWYPSAMTIHLLRRVNRVVGRPFVFYIHPWELDPNQPRVAVGSWLSRCRHYHNLAATEGRLRQLFQCFRFGTISETLAHVTTDLSTVPEGDRVLQPLAH
jgi:polysaccharide deacetylase family protein (PEP-CTERM system associated)